MDDLISRQAVIDFINEIEHRTLRMSNNNSEDILYKTVLAATKAIRWYCGSAPTAQPERKVGKWKRTYLDHEAMGERPSIFYCSECNQCIAYPVNYCPSCGSYNGGGQDAIADT